VGWNDEVKKKTKNKKKRVVMFVYVCELEVKRKVCVLWYGTK
jgi:hypothetical protein